MESEGLKALYIELTPCGTFQGSTVSVASILQDIYDAIRSCMSICSGLPYEISLFSSLSFCLSASEQLLGSVGFVLVLFGWMLSDFCCTVL